jgi:hypothetical protein
MYRERIVDARPEPVPGETTEETMRRAAVAIIRALHLRSAPLTEQYGVDLVKQVFNGVKVRPSQPQHRVADRHFFRPGGRRRQAACGGRFVKHDDD